MHAHPPKRKACSPDAGHIKNTPKILLLRLLLLALKDTD